MEGWLHCWSLSALLCCSLPTLAGGSEPRNGSSLLGLDGNDENAYKEPVAEILASLLQSGVLDVETASAWRTAAEGPSLDAKSRSSTKEKRGRKKLAKSLASGRLVAPSAVPSSLAGGVVDTSTVPSSLAGGVVDTSAVPSHLAGGVVDTSAVPSHLAGGVVAPSAVPGSPTEGVVAPTAVPGSPAGGVVAPSAVPGSLVGGVVTSSAVPGSLVGGVVDPSAVPGSLVGGVVVPSAFPGSLSRVVAPSVTPGSPASGVALTGSMVKASEISPEKESLVCVGCSGDAYTNQKSPSRSLLSQHSDGNMESVTGFLWPDGQGTVDFEIRKSFAKGERPSAAESQEDSGSGDPHVKMSSGQVTHSSSPDNSWNFSSFLATSTPSQTSSTGSSAMLSPSTEKAISPDSAEIDHLLQVSRETSEQPPSPSGTDSLYQPHKEVSFEAGQSRGSFTVLEKVSRPPIAQGAQGSTDITVVTEKSPLDTLPSSIPPSSPAEPSEPPSELIDLDYRDSSDIDQHFGFPAGGDSTKGFHDKLDPWHKHLFYDDFSPFDYVYPTPPFYADGYEEVGIEDDDDDEDDLEEAEESDDDITARDVRHFPKVNTITPKTKTAMADEKPTSPQDPRYRGETYPKAHPEVTRDHTHHMAGTAENGTECRNGYVRRNNSCRSLCEIYPTYCYNGGQCYIVENIGAFCRCNTQDYIWHKGLRCESIITDFQVMCVAVGTAALVLLLLFMMTVCFAKKLYLLKTENYKLRKRNRYRTPSELHNDNFSLSTIAEGSHPNEDPNTLQKVQDLPKAGLKDEEPFNIQNSLSPKHDCSKADPDIVDVNCVLNNLT